MSSLSYRLAVSVFALFHFAYGAQTGATVGGAVTDVSGAPVSGASISLYQIAGSAKLRSVSGAGGQFSFLSVAPGQYLLDATATGLTMGRSQTITVGREDIDHLDLQLIVSTVRTQVSVTAADAPQSADQVSKALDTVSVDDAERRGIFSVSEAVRFVPGLRVSTRGGPGTFTTIETRGLRVTDTAVLIDGFPFRDPTSIQDEASAYLGDMLLTDSTRIEVLRGSGSSLYGSNAMSGTVNIITDSGGGPMHGDLDVQGGGLGLFRGLAHVGGGAFQDRLTYSAGVSHLNVTDGIDSAGAVRDWNGQGYLGYALTSKMRVSTDIFANTGFLQENVSPITTATAPTSGVISAVPLTGPQIKLAEASLPYNSGSATFVPSLADPDAGRYSHFIHSLFRFEDQVSSRFSYRVGYAILDSARNNTNGPAGPLYQGLFNSSDKYSGRVDTLRGQVNYRLGNHQIITAGYEFERENYLDVTGNQNPNPITRIANRTKARQQTNAAFAQDELRFLNGRLEVLLSGRFTQASLSNPIFVGDTSPYVPLPSPPAAYTGDASVAYFVQRTSTKLRAHVGNSYRLPSLYERFGGYFYGGFFIPSGDPRLAPERAVSGDFGFDQYLLHDHLKLSSTYFYSHLQSVIGFLYFPPGFVDPYGRSGGYYNTPGAISRGVEVSGEFHPSRATSVLASYTYTNALDRASQYYTGTAVSPLQTPRILPHNVTLVATQQVGKRIDLGMDFEGGSSYLYPLYAYFGFEPQAYRFPGPRLLGLNAGYTQTFSERFTARYYVRASNALNQNYFEDGFRTPRRWLVGGIRFGF